MAENTGGDSVLDHLPLYPDIDSDWESLLYYCRHRNRPSGCAANLRMLVGLYLVCYFMREFVEAKLMGKKMGLSPLETLMSMYVGLQLFGFLGFILGPVGLMLIEDLVEEYWKNGNNTCNKRNNCDKISE